MDFEIDPIEKNGQRVLTTAQLAEFYGTDGKIISHNFTRNKERYIEGKHYYCLEGEDLKGFFAFTNLANANKIRILYLWTEKGALLHAKSLNTDRAWEAYDLLVENYFKVREITRLTDAELMATAVLKAQKMLETKDEKILQLTTENAVQKQQIAELQPKGSYYDVVLNCKDLSSVTTIAKDYGRSARWLNELLHQKGVQFKQGGIWILYRKYAEKGYTNTKTHIVNGNDGGLHTKVFTYWTQKGRLFIYDLLKNDGILPNVERR